MWGLNKEKKRRKTHVSFRMNVLFFIVFLLFSILILRLGVMQIVYGEDYKREIQRTEDTTVNTSVPRGLIIDRNGKVVVGNKPLDAITYTRAKNQSPDEMLKVARQLSKIIDQKTDRITDRDKRDFWILLHPDKAAAKLSKEEQSKLEQKDQYKLQVDRVTDEELKSLTKEDLKVLAIYREMSSGYDLTPQIIKNESVTPEEYASVNENLSSLPGVDTTVDWDRYYVYDKTLRTILGKVSSSKEGLPREKVEYYLARDYSRNDRVGKSYIEMQYEDVLRGQKAKVKNITDTRTGNVLESKVIQEGKRGKDVVLTIDMELQKQVDSILEDSMKASKSWPGTGLLDRAFIVMMDPHTGEILAMAGKQYVYNEETNRYEFKDFASGTFTTSYAMGSAVKGATVLTGYMTGVNHPGKQILDEPLYIYKTPKKSSWFNRSGAMWIDEQFALKRSSNVYMFKTAIEMGGGRYVRDGTLKINKEKAFKQFRDHFTQFGLGTRTGIDLPGEQIGFKGSDEMPGHVLDYSIGQYDTYTPMQLAQYISTIANGGYRMEPHIVKEIREPVEGNDQLGPIVEEISPKVLNRLDLKPGWLESVQRALYGVVHSSGGTGTALGMGEYAKYNIAAKTGTAETYDRKTSVWNSTLVAYAPYNNPEVAIAVAVPSAYLNSPGVSDPHTNIDIGGKAFKAYFDLKEKRAKQGLDESKSKQRFENYEEAKKEQAKNTVENSDE